MKRYLQIDIGSHLHASEYYFASPFISLESIIRFMVLRITHKTPSIIYVIVLMV